MICESARCGFDIVTLPLSSSIVLHCLAIALLEHSLSPASPSCTQTPFLIACSTRTQVGQQQASVERLCSEVASAEQLSSEAMHSAEAAVHEEMEAMTVARDIQDAFTKSMVDLHDLGETFASNALRSSEEQAKAFQRSVVIEAPA